MPSNSHHLISVSSTSREARARRGAEETKGRAQEVIDCLGQRCLLSPKQRESTPKCRLGCEPPQRRGGACSACTVRRELEIDEEIGRLIDNGTFRRAGVCPYQVLAAHLVAGLSLGPEFFRARRRKFRVDPVVEARAAHRHIGYILGAGPDKENIEEIAASCGDAWWLALREILVADRALGKALKHFKARTRIKPGSSPRGRTGDLRTQAIARAVAGAWRQLRGRLPAKGNLKFQRLLLAAMTTIFGHSEPEPSLEWATAEAVKRIKRDAASRR